MACLLASKAAAAEAAEEEETEGSGLGVGREGWCLAGAKPQRFLSLDGGGVAGLLGPKSRRKKPMWHFWVASFGL